MTDRLALIADEDTVLGFGSLGMDCFTAENKQSALDALKNIADKKYAVVFVTDEISDLLGEEISLYARKVLLMRIPSCRSRKEMGLEEITAVVEKAIGIANIMDKT
jgi:V/A-type H+-transporting ATPase subunit F